MGWLQSVGSIKLKVSFAKEPYKRDAVLQKRYRLPECCSWLHNMGWLRSVGSIELKVSFVKEPYKRDDVLQKRSIIHRSY